MWATWSCFNAWRSRAENLLQYEVRGCAANMAVCAETILRPSFNGKFSIIGIKLPESDVITCLLKHDSNLKT